MFQLVADIQLCNIRSLYWQKQQRNTPCGILKLSVNGVSTVLELPYFLIKAARAFLRA
jgi:hypothetical protein